MVVLSALGGVVSVLARKWWLFALCGLLLSLGSVNGGLAFPFLFLNALMDAVARPLTQPTRFLMLALIGFSVCAAIGGQWLAKRYPKAVWACWLVLLLDGFVGGGLSLRPPVSQLPSFTCSQSLSGPILIWPWDALDGEKSTSQRYQMIHQQPAAHTGIASWRLTDDKRIEQELRGIGFRRGTNRISTHRLYELGYRWVLLDKTAEPILGGSSDAAVLGRSFGGGSVDCGDHVAYEIVRLGQGGVGR